MIEQESSEGQLKDNIMIKVGTIYVISGWLLIQFSDIALEAFESPVWIMQSILLIVLAGFPVTLVGVWTIRGRHYTPRQSFMAITLVAGSILTSTLGYFFYSSNLVEQDLGDDSTAAAEQRVIREKNPVLAVLPFNNMSNDESNEFLADGMTEDIITLLAQSPGLDVIARNSTYQYKGTNPDIREVGKHLNADYVIEGSIRPLGSRIRATVQVIDSNTGAHIWAKQFDRELSGFFDIQDEVSLGIAAATGDAVFREEYRNLNQSRTQNMSAWGLTSKAVLDFNTLVSGAEVIDRLRRSIEIDPDYALSYAALGRSLAALGLYGGEGREFLIEAEAVSRKALRLAPDDPKVLAFSSVALMWCGMPQEALPMAKKAADISPSYAEGLVYFGDTLTHNGRPEDALELFDRAIKLTPDAPELGMYYLMKAEAEIHLGEFDVAQQTLFESNRLAPNSLGYIYQSGVELLLGQEQDATNTYWKARGGSLGYLVQGHIDIMNSYTTDGGGPNFKALWAKLVNLEQRILAEPAK
jgi:TolB-like protein/Flp pilus assembly protein TadD